MCADPRAGVDYLFIQYVLKCEDMTRTKTLRPYHVCNGASAIRKYIKHHEYVALPRSESQAINDMYERHWRARGRSEHNCSWLYITQTLLVIEWAKARQCYAKHYAILNVSHMRGGDHTAWWWILIKANQVKKQIDTHACTRTRR